MIASMKYGQMHHPPATRSDRPEKKEKKISTPVLIVASKDSIGDFIDSLSSGIDQYILKPFEYNDLLLHVKNILAKKRYKESVGRKVS